jgi:hypothetical protein
MSYARVIEAMRDQGRIREEYETWIAAVGGPLGRFTDAATVGFAAIRTKFALLMTSKPGELYRAMIQAFPGLPYDENNTGELLPLWATNRAIGIGQCLSSEGTDDLAMLIRDGYTELAFRTAEQRLLERWKRAGGGNIPRLSFPFTNAQIDHYRGDLASFNSAMPLLHDETLRRRQRNDERREQEKILEEARKIDTVRKMNLERDVDRMAELLKQQQDEVDRRELESIAGYGEW